ncbi:MAG: hypothetical protein HZA53_12445 [Planctomycetes bacterium]|nr:hypothetical protein [Planctomycetota bacterium]
MKLLTFLARRFAWTPHAVTAPEAAEPAVSGAMEECVVVFVHAERLDQEAARRASTLKQAQKHVEWLARKRSMRRCVLHSFTHLGVDTADPAFARAWIVELGDRLARRGFEVVSTPFGHTNAWELAVHGEAVAKVWKSLPGADPSEGREPPNGEPEG